MTAPVAIFACGNPSRGDDALGPLLLDRLQTWLEVEGLAGGFDLIGDFQLQIEHALDLAGRELALFIDAGSGTPAPFLFRPANAANATPHSTHALSPEAVLTVYAQIAHEAAPPAYVLCVRGETFELGEGLSAAAEANAIAAFALLQSLCRGAEGVVWAARCGSHETAGQRQLSGA
ncbi:MAG: hydrogenase maturation protease [Betaproteobacteria bacterium]|nr:hydrogenase maturation protease [Betaproteobacteria bacterium]